MTLGAQGPLLPVGSVLTGQLRFGEPTTRTPRASSSAAQTAQGAAGLPWSGLPGSRTMRDVMAEPAKWEAASVMVLVRPSVRPASSFHNWSEIRADSAHRPVKNLRWSVGN
jgi:hypothetical protein